MPIRAVLLIATLAGLAACAPSLAEDVDRMDVAPDDIVFLGESAIYPNATIAQTIASAEVFSSLAGLVERAEMADELDGAGPFTLFAPTDAALANLPALTDEALRQTLRHHIVRGRIGSAELAARIAAGGGSYAVETLAGDTLVLRRAGEGIVIARPEGGSVAIGEGDLAQANGMIHVIEGALLPGG